jgi:2-polyprenyl-3-methyl-5-hydroxy-6-metoxy-1,4-benzoquinol methylase
MSDQPTPFAYSDEFKEAIRSMLTEHEKAPGAPDWVALAVNRVEEKRRNFLPVISRYVQLAGLQVLEIGCGSGPASVVMAEQGATVTAVDLDPRMAHAAQLRVRDHGLSDVVHVQPSSSGDRLDFPADSFDLVICNGVFEHVQPEFRDGLLREIWRVLRHGGHVFLGETPNRLWPQDVHTTELWFLHYLPRGLATRYARLRKQISPTDDLVALGGLGCFYWRLVAPLPAPERLVLNMVDNYSWVNRHRREAAGSSAVKRILFGALNIVERFFFRPLLRMPTDALLPYLTICVRKN